MRDRDIVDVVGSECPRIGRAGGSCSTGLRNENVGKIPVVVVEGGDSKIPVVVVVVEGGETSYRQH